MKLFTKYALLLLLLYFSFASHATERKSVLMISSYNSNFPTFFNDLDGVKSVLDSIHIDLDIEFMDSKRFQDDKTIELFTKLLSHKLNNTKKYTAILTADDNAFAFALKYQDSLFKNIPIVFFGVNNKQTILDQKKNPYVTGIAEETSMKETIESMVKLFPDSDKMYAIVDKTNTGQADLKKFYHVVEDKKEIEYEVLDLRHLTFEELQKKIKNIPQSSPVLLISAYTDKTGYTMNFDETLQRLHKHLKAPLFHLWKHGINNGIIGGKLVSHYEQGKRAGIYVKKILSGFPVQELEVITQSPNTFMFDYNQLKKHKIKVEDLPAGSKVINQPKNFYSENKKLVNTLSIIFIALFIIILILYTNNIKRRKIQTELEKEMNYSQWLRKRQSALISNISDVIGIIGTDGLIKYKSPNIKSIFGYNQEELIGKPWHTAVHDKDKNRLKKRLKKLTTEKGITEKFEFNYIHKNGQTIPVELTASNHTETPHIQGVLINYKDISDRKSVEFELKESESKYRLLAESAHHLILLHDLTGVIKYINPHGEKLLGIDKDQIIGSNIQQLISNKEIIEQKSLIKQAVKGEINQHITNFEIYNTKLEKTIYLHMIANPIFRNHEITEILVTAYNITDTKIAQEKLKENEKKYRMLIENQNELLINFNSDLKGLYASPNYFKTFGLIENDVINRTFTPLVHPDDVDFVKSSINDTIKSNKKSYHEARAKTPNGWKWFGWSLNTLNNNGEIEIVGVGRDITDRKEMEEDLLLAKNLAEESNKLKTEFLHNMSHEVRTPMNGIIGFSKLLNKPGITDKKRSYYSKIIENSSFQLKKVIDDILEISSLETKKVTLQNASVGLNDYLMELYSVFNLKAKENKLNLYLNKGLKDNQSYVILDRSKLSKILSNLVENAIRYTNKGHVEIGYYIKEQKLNIYVQDTGIGIPLKKQALIFERFSQGEQEISKKNGGLGLGLSISKENAELMGGQIIVESEMGTGSTFTLEIPYTPNIEMDHEQKPEQKTKIKKQILIVEDDETNYMYYEALFEDEYSFNYELTHAFDGQEAIDVCKKDYKPDLILMDIKLPKVDGYEATKEIRKIYTDIPIIAQTAYSSVGDKKKLLDENFDAYLIKPVEKEQLFNIIKRFLG